MGEITQVTGTAFVVAEFRAEENDAEQPLYRDSVVKLFLSEESREAAERIAAGFTPAKEMVRIRTRYYDDMLDRQLASGCRQVVVLGAGLDTRAARKPAEGVTYFEIDDGATLALKQSCYQENGIAAKVRFIPGNYVTDGLVDLLDQNSLDFGLPTYVIWEGNTMYLPRQIAQRVMEQLRQSLKDFRLSFDYMAEAIIAKTTGNADLTRMVEHFATMGAPWITGFNDIYRLAHGVKLRVLENVSTANLYRTYRAVAPSEVPYFGDFYSICTLESCPDPNLGGLINGKAPPS